MACLALMLYYPATATCPRPLVSAVTNLVDARTASEVLTGAAAPHFGQLLWVLGRNLNVHLMPLVLYSLVYKSPNFRTFCHQRKDIAEILLLPIAKVLFSMPAAVRKEDYTTPFPAGARGVPEERARERSASQWVDSC